MARLNAVAALACAALAALSGDAAAQSSSASLSSSSGSSSLFADIPLCDQDELIEVSEIMTTNARKLQCQSVLNVTEMVTVTDSLELCDVPSCVAALQVLYSTLPQCRYKDWPIQYECEMLLKNCGITPVNVTESSDAGSYSGSVGSTDAGDEDGGADSATTWNATSSDSSSAFAPVGVTPSPSTATPTPTPTSSSASTVAASVTLAVVTASAIASVF